MTTRLRCWERQIGVSFMHYYYYPFCIYCLVLELVMRISNTFIISSAVYDVELLQCPNITLLSMSAWTLLLLLFVLFFIFFFFSGVWEFNIATNTTFYDIKYYLLILNTWWLNNTLTIRNPISSACCRWLDRRIIISSGDTPLNKTDWLKYLASFGYCGPGAEVIWSIDVSRSLLEFWPTLEVIDLLQISEHTACSLMCLWNLLLLDYQRCGRRMAWKL